MAKKEQHKNEIFQNPEVLAHKLEDAESWIEQNSKIVIGIVALLVIAVGGYFGFTYYKDTQNDEAQKLMFYAQHYFEQDSLDLALNGDGNNLGFLAIVEDYGITDAGKLASFYAGAAYLKQGKFELARLYLEDFNSNDLLVQARAYSLIGDTYMEEQKYPEAAEFYTKAANYRPNKYFSPVYLMKAALAYEKQKLNDKAIEAYEKIIKEYSESSEYQNARKYKAMLETNS